MTITELVLTEVMDGLRVCLQTRLEGDDSPCFIGLVPGPEAVADYCSCKGSSRHCGQAWVRLAEVYPSRAFPTPDTAASNCASPLAATIEVGILRCVPVSAGDGKPPTAAEQTGAALTAARDAGELHASINCCDAVTKRAHRLTRWTPSARGGCGGGTWQVTVQLVRV